MDKSYKDLCVAVETYTKDGVSKKRYKKIGVEVTEKKDSGEEFSYLLLDRDVSLAGFPNFTDKIFTATVLVNKFEQKEKEDAEDVGNDYGDHCF